MKLSKKTLLIIAAGAFVIISASLGTVCSQQVSEKNRLKDELALAQLKLKEVQLEQLSQQQEELAIRLNQTTSQLETAKSILSQPGGSVTTSGILFEAAKAYDVEVSEVSSSGLSSNELEGIPCSALTLKATVEGDLPNLISFITELNGYLSTGAVQSVEINVPETTDAGKPTANIQLVVYTYQGS